MQTQRRALLRAVVGAAVLAPALAACDLFQPDPPPPPDPLTGFYLDTLALAALYETDSRPLVAPIRDAHKAHAAALAAIMYPPPAAASPVAPSGTPPANVREAEQEAWQKAVDTCLAAPAERATLLGEIAAARACHLEVLR
jgi:peptidoglycan/LPS O-acetylase OafA/YrhL